MNQSVQPAKKLRASITLPPDKSISHRSALFALLSEGTSEILNYSPAADPQTTLKAIEALGATVKRKQDGHKILITGTGRSNIAQETDVIDCENSGTTIRLLSGILAGSRTQTTLTGDASLSKRPMKRIINPLTEMGAEILARDETYPPLTFNPSGSDTLLKGITYELPVASAQVKSCVLLAGLFADEPTTVVETLTSRDHTERMLRFPVETGVDGKRYIVSSSNHPLEPQNLTVPGDFSAAAFWIVAALIVPGSEITLANTGLNPTRKALLEIVQSMGADVEIQVTAEEPEPLGNVTIRHSELSPTDIDPAQIPNCIDELPVLSVLFSFVDGTSSFRGAEDLRYKESDRIEAICRMLDQMSVDYEEHEDGLTIHGHSNHSFEGTTFESYHDHRIAMSSAVASLRGASASTIKDAECAAISYPTFWEDMKRIGA